MVVGVALVAAARSLRAMCGRAASVVLIPPKAVKRNVRACPASRVGRQINNRARLARPLVVVMSSAVQVGRAVVSAVRVVQVAVSVGQVVQAAVSVARVVQVLARMLLYRAHHALS
jgi:hypothetical protein